MTDLTTEILALKAERRAAILAHNYQRPEIQDVADVVADSLRMARRASELDAPLLVICGVHFMAETAAIANPDKRVLIPDPDAGCSLAATIEADDVRGWRTTHPDGLVVAYVNCSAAVKAEADYCCTSGNAVAVVRALPRDVPVLFVPDFFLGSHVRRVTGRALDVWMGECHVHAALGPADVEAKRREHPDAEFLVHPECGCVTSTMYYAAADGDVAAGRTHIVSTEEMTRRARTSPARRFVVATLPIVELVYAELDPEVRVDAACAEGEWVTAGAVLACVRASAATLLGGERVALNFLQRLSGVATVTRRVVEAVAGTGSR